ncbi:nickel pincer cofactor biosynthesis protein LarB [bacterium]|nr:nickel pincer cofactor biosynthesis protein LarB [candidate division CSSED10-310 bacterium]
MTGDDLKRLLAEFKAGRISETECVDQIKLKPFLDLEFAKVDTHRQLRKGFPEVIFGHGKTDRQILDIALNLFRAGQPLLITRISESTYTILHGKIEPLQYHSAARCAFWNPDPAIRGNGYILVICAGTSDIPVAEEAAVTAEVMGQSVKRIFDVGIAGLHRLLHYRKDLLHAEVIIVAAGMEGALPGVVGALVDRPVIGVPTSVGYGANFAGVSALLTMLNTCSSGVVAVNIDNGFGAGYAAALINRRRD